MSDQRTPCEEYGHVYKFDDDDEVFRSCVTCGEERDPEDGFTACEFFGHEFGPVRGVTFSECSSCGRPPRPS